MKTFLLLVLGFSASMGYSEDSKNVLDQFDKVREEIKNTGTGKTVEDCCGLETAKPPAADAAPPTTACISSICGTPQEAQPFSLILDKKEEEMRVAAKNPALKVPKGIQDLMDEIRKISGEQFTLLLQHTQGVLQAADFSMTRNQKALFNVLFVAGQLSKVEAVGKRVNGQLKIEIDETETRKNLDDLSTQDQDFVIRGAQSLFNAMVSSSLIEMKSIPPLVFLRKKYPGMNAEEAFNQEIKEAEEGFTKISRMSPLSQQLLRSSTDEGRLKYIRERSQARKITEDEMREVMLQNANFKVFMPTLSDSETNLFLSREVPSSQALIALAGGAPAVKTAINQYITDEKAKEESQNNLCRYAYFYNQSSLPSNQEIESLKVDTLRAKQLTQSRILPLYSEKTRKMLAVELDKTSFSFPASKTEFEDAYKRYLTGKRDKDRRALQEMKTIPPQDLQAYALMVGTVAQALGGGDNKVEDNVFCGPFLYSAVSDGNYTGFGAISLSYSTAISRPETRLFIALHELGHSLSSAMLSGEASDMSLKKFKGSRACLEGQHTEELPPQTKKIMTDAAAKGISAEGYYNEEDYGDIVAAWAGKQDYGRNPWCQLMDVNTQSGQYAASTLQAEDEDVHSSGLYRLLHLEYRRKSQFSPACNDLFKQSPAPHYMNCLD